MHLTAKDWDDAERGLTDALDSGDTKRIASAAAVAARWIVRHLRNSPADGKAERGEGEVTHQVMTLSPGDEELKEIDFAAQRLNIGAGSTDGKLRVHGRRALYYAGFRAGQQSRLDERERARLGTLCAAWFRLFWPRVLLVLEDDEEASQPGSMGDMLRQAIADGKMLFDQAAKSDALGEGRKA